VVVTPVRAVALTLISLTATAAVVQACALDNVPSMSMNGALAAYNNKIPHDLHLYAPFFFKRPAVVGRRIQLTENRRECARSLTRSSMAHAARWRFGDGSTAYGWKVHHVYAHSGTYRATVFAYYAKGKSWYPFDEVDVTVRR
jgi:hypothetical protein